MLRINFIEVQDDDSIKLVKTIRVADARAAYDAVEGQTGFAMIDEDVDTAVGAFFAGEIAWYGEYAALHGLPMNPEEVEAFRGN